MNAWSMLVVSQSNYDAILIDADQQFPSIWSFIVMFVSIIFQLYTPIVYIIAVCVITPLIHHLYGQRKKINLYLL